jgi:hypothetical protein
MIAISIVQVISHSKKNINVLFIINTVSFKGNLAGHNGALPLDVIISNEVNI